MDSEDQKNTVTVKLVLLGDSNVGKTTIINKYTKPENQNKDYMTTVCPMYQSKSINLKNKIYNIQVWDTAGQERFRSITPMYFRDAHGILLVCDITAKKSLESVNFWYKMIQEKCHEKTKILILANKSDLVNEIEITDREIEQFCKELSCEYVKTSGFTGNGIQVRKTYFFIFRKLLER